MTRDTRPKPLTRTYLERAALHYLERYSSSAENLRRILTNKARKRIGPETALDDTMLGMVADVVERLVRGGFVDDRSFADAKASSLARRGTSTRAIRQKLEQKGVAAEAVAAALAELDPDELALARRYAERRRLGPWRTRPDPDAREKDLASLCRAGFPYRIAVAAIAPVEPD